ncbi:MAG: hypothetical protein KZQ63_06685 [Candidatus Thiodiazotropha sp. (ex Lucinoma aequizonata)]|nr:hypothetical protein [Candidatus Thiodiazotropha sp. (ex Lucinoma aequizonata)]
MGSLYALHLSLSVAIPVIQPRLRLSGTNRLRSAFHGGQRKSECFPSTVRQWEKSHRLQCDYRLPRRALSWR